MNWMGKRVLVTGADGFIGSHLTELLVESGAKVRALSLYNSFNNWGWLEDIKSLKEVEVITGDVRDFQCCLKIVKDCDIVFNLAALIAIPYSYQAPQSYVDTNITGTLNMCQAALTHGCEKFIQTSTSEVYGSALYVPIDEKHPLQPQSPYSASKIGSDAIAMSFFSSFKLPVSIARPFNTYGPRQSARAVIPTIISQMRAGKKEIQLGDTRPTRDFNYVGDTAGGLMRLAELDRAVGETFNLGSNSEISIENLFHLIKSILKSDAKLVHEKSRLRPENSEVVRLWCDNRKFLEASKFVPRFSLEDGLRKTCDWFSVEENLKKYKVDIYNV